WSGDVAALSNGYAMGSGRTRCSLISLESKKNLEVPVCARGDWPSQRVGSLGPVFRFRPEVFCGRFPRCRCLLSEDKTRRPAAYCQQHLGNSYYTNVALCTPS